MTVTFIDSPNSVIGKTEALDFTASGEVIAISVAFGAGVRAEERAYRDGVFLYPYLRSSKAGNTYSLVRDGGWPGDPKLYVDELQPTAAAAASPEWKVLYTQDFAALPNQTFAPGANIIGGQRWWMKGPLVAGDFVDIVNGQGMRIDQAFVGSLSHPLNDTIGALSSSLLLNFTELPAYNRRNPIAAQFRFTRTNDPGLYQYVYGVGELVSCAGNGSIVANAERVGTQGILNGIPVPGGVGYYGSFGTRGHGAVDMPAVGTPSGYNLAQDRQVISIGGNAHGRGGWASIKQAKDAVVWPSLYDGYASGLLECPGSSTPSADIDLGFCFWVFNADGVNGFRPGVVLRAVRILQAGG